MARWPDHPIASLSAFEAARWTPPALNAQPWRSLWRRWSLAAVRAQSRRSTDFLEQESPSGRRPIAGSVFAWRFGTPASLPFATEERTAA